LRNRLTNAEMAAARATNAVTATALAKSVGGKAIANASYLKQRAAARSVAV
jgi:hypothetical protein